MTPFIIGIMLLLLVLIGGRVFTRIDPRRLAFFLRTFVAALGTMGSAGLLFSGRLGLALMTMSAAVVALNAMRRGGGGAAGSFGHGAGTPPSGQSSEIRTDMLAMELDHGSGDLDGEVLAGPFAGRSLESLGLGDLLALLADCQREDPRSVALLETYLDRREPDWREHVDPGEAADGGGSGTAGGSMDDATARSILGVGEDAGEAEIKAAHRRLMTKLHPDHGGTGFLATQINQAKDQLLNRRR